MSDCTEERVCRICYSEINPITKKKDLISPCRCSGTVKYVHYSCLKLWRMRGKAFGDMSKCEQCHGTYNIPGERTAYSLFISFSTLIFLASIYLFANTIFKNTGEIILYVTDQWNIAEYPERNNLGVYDIDRSYYMACLMFLLSSYKLKGSSNIILIISYVASYITLGLYHILISRIVFFCISLKFLIDAYLESYKMIDGFYYYLLNLNWEHKYLKE
jgi:hypothetical protein